MVDININLNIPLLEKMWETLDERFIATWMNPKRIRREGEVYLQLDRKKRLQEIEMERANTDIERAQIMHSGSGSLARVEPRVDFERLAEIEKKQEYIRKQINLGKTILYAEDEITVDDPIPEKDVDPDWLYRWKEQAEKFSTEDMQLLWGKVLAGEFKSPGSFNYRALDTLSNLSKEDAEDFLLVCSLAFSYRGETFVFSNSEINNTYGLHLLKKMKLQEVGLLSYSLNSLSLDEEVVLYSDKHKKVIVCSADLGKRIGVTFFTEVGKSLYKLIDVALNLGYIRDNLSFFLEKDQINSKLASGAVLSPDGTYVEWEPDTVEEFK